jgi:site-specific recombinase XerD
VDTTTVLGHLDRTILEVFYATGIRSEELRNATLQRIKRNLKKRGEKSEQKLKK